MKIKSLPVTIQKNRFLINILIPFLLVLPILWLALGTIALGTDNLRMIKHFDIDESSLVEFAGKTYTRVFVPLENNVTYPQLFYYLAGIILFPFTLLKGVDYQVIVIVLRGLNTLAGMFTAIFIYFFCIKFFRSILAGVLASLLFSTTPGYICWLLNSRPHPLEILFILFVFYFCFRIIEQYRNKFLLGAIVFCGLATATKFGGLFLIPILWLACLYYIVRLKTPVLAEHLKHNITKIYMYVSGIIVFSVLIPVAVIQFYFKYQDKFHIFGIKDFNDFLRYRNFRLLLLVVGVAILGSLLWLVINMVTQKNLKNNSLAEKYRSIFILDKSMLFLLYIFTSNLLIFLLFNPSYILYPLSTFKQMGVQFAKSTMSTAFDPGLSRTILDSSGLVWIKMLFEDQMINSWLALLFAAYLIYEIIYFRKNWKSAKASVYQRLLLLAYVVFLFMILIVLVSHRPHHYLLPIVMALSILTSFGIIAIIQQARSTLWKRFLILVFSIILLAGFCVRFGNIAKLYELRKSRASAIDTGILVGDWLKNNFNSNLKIWVDCNEFYIPPKFNNISFMFISDRIERKFDTINKFDPDILVITCAYDPFLKNAQKIDLAIKEGALGKFKLEKVFDYQGPLSDFGYYKKIFIYTKSGNYFSKGG